MPYAFRSVGLMGSSFNAPCTAGQPAGIIANDLLVMASMEFLGTDGRPVVPGWLDISHAVAWTTGAAVYAKIAAGNDSMPAIPSWGNQFQLAVCLAYSGGPSTLAGLVDVLNCSDKSYNSAGTISFNSTGLPTNDSSLIIAISFKNTLGNGSPVLNETGDIAGFNRRVTYWPNAVRPTIVIDDLIQPIAAIVDNAPGMFMNFTEASTQAGHSTILIFNPAVITGPPTSTQEQPARLSAAARPSSLHEFWPVAIELLNMPPVVFPPNNFDLPSYLPRARSSALLGIEQATPRPLVGKDRVLTPVDWQYGWDRPQLPAALRTDSYPLAANELTQLSNFPPYIEANWPVPPGPRQWNRSYEFSVNLNLVGKDAMPLGVLHTVSWDPPAGPRRPLANLGFEQAGLALVNTFQPMPAISTRHNDWPVPLRPRQPVQDFIQGMPEVILSALSTLPPFRSLQEPPLRRPTLSAALLSFDWSRITLLSGKDLLPFGMQYTQQNIRIVYRADIYTITQANRFLIPIAPPILPGGQGVRHMGRVIVDPAKIGEAVTIPFDFISGLEAGEVLTSASTTARLYTGTDGAPQSIISAAASVGGTIALQQVTPTIVGNIYDLTCTVITSLGNVLSLDAYFAIVPGLP